MSMPTVLQWELHAPGSVISFDATRDDDNGYGLVIRRDDALIAADVAADVSALLRKSRALRSHLEQIGYTASPLCDNAPRLVGGVYSS